VHTRVVDGLCAIDRTPHDLLSLVGVTFVKEDPFVAHGKHVADAEALA
jgi:hypothetical protein